MYSAIHEFKELCKVIDNDRLKSFTKSLKDSEPDGFKSMGKPLIECKDSEINGDIVDTILSIEGASGITHSMLNMIVQSEVTDRFINNKL